MENTEYAKYIKKEIEEVATMMNEIGKPSPFNNMFSEPKFITMEDVAKQLEMIAKEIREQLN